MKIWKTMNRVPGGLMVCPLFLGMVINTFFPHLLKIGGFTEALSGIGYPTVLGMYLFAVGTKMTMRAAPKMLKRGFGILAAKIGVATIFALTVAKLFHGNILPGVLLGITVFIVTGFCCIVADKLLGGSGVAGAAASSTAGNSAAVPQAVAMADRNYAGIAPAATVQVAASVIVTAILTPILTAWMFRKVTKASAAASSATGASPD